jgi:hypothetical protein
MNKTWTMDKAISKSKEKLTQDVAFKMRRKLDPIKSVAKAALMDRENLHSAKAALATDFIGLIKKISWQTICFMHSITELKCQNYPCFS